jgi:transcription antitermination factor NusG
MPLCWYAITSKIMTKDKFLRDIKKSGLRSPLREIKNVIVYDFKTDDLDLSHDDSLLKGYALIQLDDRVLKEVQRALEASKLGRFIGLGPKGVPYPVTKEEVTSFNGGVRHKRETFRIRDKVRVTDGILKGLCGVVVKKSKLMLGIKVFLPHSTILRSVSIMSVEKRK